MKINIETKFDRGCVVFWENRFDMVIGKVEDTRVVFEKDSNDYTAHGVPSISYRVLPMGREGGIWIAESSLHASAEDFLSKHYPKV